MSKKKEWRHPLARQPVSTTEKVAIFLTLLTLIGGLIAWKTWAWIECLNQFGFFTCWRMIR